MPTERLSLPAVHVDHTLRNNQPLIPDTVSFVFGLATMAMDRPDHTTGSQPKKNVYYKLKPHAADHSKSDDSALIRAAAAGKYLIDSNKKTRDTTPRMVNGVPTEDGGSQLRNHTFIHVSKEHVQKMCQELRDNIDTIRSTRDCSIEKSEFTARLFQSLLVTCACLYVAGVVIGLLALAVAGSALVASGFATPLGLAIVAGALGALACLLWSGFIGQQSYLEIEGAEEAEKKAENMLLKDIFKLEEAPLIINAINEHFESERTRRKNHRDNIDQWNAESLLDFEDLMVQLYGNNYQRRLEAQ